ncbi:FdhF/YdeP family oxidoreductase [Lactococcus termiticola]|uniref:Putative oxidoreductase Rv2900c n=1 Tax=Lactococcus termiticola TaxID=2169526 RepID=A0A2R5HFE4_9LACT|nr:FdhF/YdeP family oxidoreductase [Lactococcus termiticola]GBG96767.1 putative oxidoreductase Rv2900c [Lactococcus termiticola]
MENKTQTNFGLMPNEPRQGGFGPKTDKAWSQEPYHHAAAGWGATMSVGKVVMRTMEPYRGTRAMLTMNHPCVGFDCPGCAWPNDPDGIMLDICENGIKHATTEMTSKRTTPEFFSKHTVAELSKWTDFDLENEGRLTDPMSYNPETDKYETISWDDAYKMIAEELNGLDNPNQAAFYTSGRLSNEATYVYQAFTRDYGTNNQPDCSNMCHEATGRALNASIATGVGTVDLRDWRQTDALFVVGANSASNTPRMLTELAHIKKHGGKLVHVNPLREAASTKTIVPHEFINMATFNATDISGLDLQVRLSGDMALFRGIAKCVFEADAAGVEGAIDYDFIDKYSQAFQDYRKLVEETSWDYIMEQSGLTEEEIREAGQIYLDADKAIIAWCLGLAQQEFAVDAIREIMNVLLLRGNIGRPGAGPSPIRGHSNVQGNRTVGINHHPEESFLVALDKELGITSPRERGKGTVDTCIGMMTGDIKVFIGMGGNFTMAAPDTAFTAEGMSKCNLTVQVSTKLNRSHLTHGKKALILPCLARSEYDKQAAGKQMVSTEDSMSWIQLGAGKNRPASKNLRSEVAIICEMAMATLPNSPVNWQAFKDDYDVIRDSMSRVITGFENFNENVKQKRGFRRPQPARERRFLTPSGKAEFSLAPLQNVIPEAEGALSLQTMRSHDQWNTTIYTNNDRYRGVKNIREMIFMNKRDMKMRGLESGDLVDIKATAKDGSVREVKAFRVIGYDISRGCTAGYMPELNALIGVSDMSHQSEQPLMKSLHVHVTKHA